MIENQEAGLTGIVNNLHLEHPEKLDWFIGLCLHYKNYERLNQVLDIVYTNDKPSKNFSDLNLTEIDMLKRRFKDAGYSRQDMKRYVR